MKRLVVIMGLVLVIVLLPILTSCLTPEDSSFRNEELQAKIDELQAKVDKLLKEQNIFYHDIYMNNPEYDQSDFVTFPPIAICNNEIGIDYSVWLINNTDGVLAVHPDFIFKSNKDYYVLITSIDLVVSSENDSLKHKGSTEDNTDSYNDNFCFCWFGKNVGGIDTSVFAIGGGEDYQSNFYIDSHNQREFKIHVANIACENNVSWTTEVSFGIHYIGEQEK